MWYSSTFNPKPTSNNKNYIIGVTAFTRTAIENLLKRISGIQNQVTIINLKKNSLKEFIVASTLPINENPGNPIVIGGTVWDWYKVRKEWNYDWSGCDMMIIDESSQAS